MLCDETFCGRKHIAEEMFDVASVLRQETCCGGSVSLGKILWQEAYYGGNV